jgi:hypothetical protein
MIDASPAERDLLVAACRGGNRQFVEHSDERPSEWRPYEVLDLRLATWNICFTDAAAFQFAADKIESGHPVEKVKLARPPGADGYAIKIAWPDGRVLYIKLEIKGEIVFGRSFHFSVKTGR